MSETKQKSYVQRWNRNHGEETVRSMNISGKENSQDALKAGKRIEIIQDCGMGGSFFRCFWDNPLTREEWSEWNLPFSKESGIYDLNGAKWELKRLSDYEWDLRPVETKAI